MMTLTEAAAIDAMPTSFLALELAQLANRLADPKGVINTKIAAELVAEAADRLTNAAPALDRNGQITGYMLSADLLALCGGDDVAFSTIDAFARLSAIHEALNKAAVR